MNPVDKVCSLTDALILFVRTIEAAGGIHAHSRGYFTPVGDPDWIDLGEAYVEACAVLGRQCKIMNEMEEDNS